MVRRVARPEPDGRARTEGPEGVRVRYVEGASRLGASRPPSPRLRRIEAMTRFMSLAASVEIDPP